MELMTGKISERDPREEILKAFRLFDDDSTGKISLKNLKRVARELGETMTDEELQEMIDEADRDGDGEINEEEFIRIMKKTNLFWWINIMLYNSRISSMKGWMNTSILSKSSSLQFIQLD